MKSYALFSFYVSSSVTSGTESRDWAAWKPILVPSLGLQTLESKCLRTSARSGITVLT